VVNTKLLWNVEWVLWLVSANGILEEWSGYVWWLALSNVILKGWPDYVWWLALANGILKGWLGWVLWLTSVNGIWDGWPGLNIIISFGSWWTNKGYITYVRTSERTIFFKDMNEK